MSSEDVAKYLYEVGANQRKLEYCRQILTSNTNFIPQCVFNLRDPMNTNTQTKSQFIENLKTLSLGCNPQEESLIFNYFQIDSKNYITFGQFQDLVIPQKDQALKKLVAMRRKEEFSLDYSLRFALQKFFFQIIENQVKLELMCKFTFPKTGEDHKLKSRRLDDASLSQFMAAHGKYPDGKTLQYIVREINLNKGDCKRNKLITEYIISFNDKYKKKGQPLPQILAKEPLVVTTSARKQSLQPSKENNNISNYTQEIDFTLTKPERNPLLAYNPLQKLSTPISQGKGTNVLEPISEVEKRINSLMSQVNSSLKNNSNNSPIRQMYKKGSGKQQQLQSSIVQSIKDQLQREKNRGEESKISKNDAKETIGLKLKSQIKRNYQLNSNCPDKLSKIEDLQYDAVTEKSHTDRLLDNLPKKKNEQDQDVASHSQLIYKLNGFGSPPKQSSHSMVGKFDYRVTDKSKREEKAEDPYKKRIQYLKNLIDDKGCGRVGA